MTFCRWCLEFTGKPLLNSNNMQKANFRMHNMHCICCCKIHHNAFLYLCCLKYAWKCIYVALMYGAPLLTLRSLNKMHIWCKCCSAFSYLFWPVGVVKVEAFDGVRSVSCLRVLDSGRSPLHWDRIVITTMHHRQTWFVHPSIGMWWWSKC